MTSEMTPTEYSCLTSSFQLLVKQLYSVGVMSLVIIVVSGAFIGMVLALQGFSILPNTVPSRRSGRWLR